jgi:hypothetical protein
LDTPFWHGETVAWLDAHGVKYRCLVLTKFLMERGMVKTGWILKHKREFIESNLMQALHIASFTKVPVLCFPKKVLCV